MTIAITLAVVMLLCALVPACLFLINLRRFCRPIAADPEHAPHVAVLIPARNEEANIADALRRVLASRNVTLDVLVYDDVSADNTAAIVREIAAQDARVRLIEGPPLPQGWNGKQHACWRLAQASAAPLLLFLDADVRLERTAIAQCIAQRRASDVSLLSGFPRILTITWLEWLLLPLVHFVLLGFLPMGRMRRTTEPACAAGCGQFMLAERESYFACGGHAAIRETRHDGLRLPRLFREHSLRTDICDLSELAHARMYQSAADVWDGLAKNATEGLGAPSRIVPLTLLFLIGQVLPPIAATLCIAVMTSVAVAGAVYDEPARIGILFALVFLAFICGYLPRLIGVRHFCQPLRSALLHPLGIVVLLVIQWYALARQLAGKPVGWRARRYNAGSGKEVL